MRFVLRLLLVALVALFAVSRADYDDGLLDGDYFAAYVKKGGPQGPLRFGKRRGPSGPLRFGKRSDLLGDQRPPYY
ncbi:unnamed protein product [Caenorhabditis auriculariae]|uniref:Uncharacterized protein n=1 Tax=Caenorhabditis auriculariae TaxID=2777116 RepID=A0A8S1GSV6_9PELO|nr:unnamed protein product [Caenorhabditis auriculariae]